MSGGRSKKKRVPDNPTVGKPQKRPRQEYHPDRFKSLDCSWKLCELDFGGPFSWANVKSSSLNQIFNRMKEFEQKSIYELDQAGCHAIPVERLGKPAQDRLVALSKEDYDELFSFRIGKKMRVWGFLDRNMFRILWFDPHHKVYPMNITGN